jgi:hypothetical protein
MLSLSIIDEKVGSNRKMPQLLRAEAAAENRKSHKVAINILLPGGASGNPRRTDTSSRQDDVSREISQLTKSCRCTVRFAIFVKSDTSESRLER